MRPIEDSFLVITLRSGEQIHILTNVLPPIRRFSTLTQRKHLPVQRLEKFQQGIERPDSPVQGIDEGIRADELGYGSWDVREQLAKFASERAKTIAYLRTLSPEDWSKAIVHNEKGRQTAMDQANQLLGHDLYHIDHLTEYIHEKVAGTW